MITWRRSIVIVVGWHRAMGIIIISSHRWRTMGFIWWVSIRRSVVPLLLFRGGRSWIVIVVV